MELDGRRGVGGGKEQKSDGWIIRNLRDQGVGIVPIEIESARRVIEQHVMGECNAVPCGAMTPVLSTSSTASFGILILRTWMRQSVQITSRSAGYFDRRAVTGPFNPHGWSSQPPVGLNLTMAASGER